MYAFKYLKTLDIMQTFYRTELLLRENWNRLKHTISDYVYWVLGYITISSALEL